MNAYFHMPSYIQHTYLGLIGLHLREAMIPLLVGVVASLAIAQLCVRFRWLYAPVLSVTTVLYAIPSLAFFVVLIDYTGATETTVEIPLAVYSLVLLVPAVVDGVRSVPPETLAAATAMGFGPMQRYLKVQLPIAVPAILAGLRVAAASSISLVSVGSLIGNEGALGNLLTNGLHFDRPPLVVTSVVTSAALAVLVDGVLVLLGRALTPWMPRDKRPRAPWPRRARGDGDTAAVARTAEPAVLAGKDAA